MNIDPGPHADPHWFGKMNERIAVLESKLTNEGTATVMLIKDLKKHLATIEENVEILDAVARGAALEARKIQNIANERESRIQEIETLLLSASTSRTELHERITSLEANLTGFDIATKNFTLDLAKRIAALESEFKDFSAWALELLGPIGPPPRFDQRIYALETAVRNISNGGHMFKEQTNQWISELENRIAALEEKLRKRADVYIADLEDSSIESEKRIAALEAGMNTDRYEADWKFDTDRRLARLENTDAGVRITALESAVNNISAELGGWLAHDKRIAALETCIRGEISAREALEDDAEDSDRRIATLEEIGALEERLHECRTNTK